MKKLLFIICILVIPLSIFSQRKFKDGIIVEDTTDVDVIKFSDGTTQTTAGGGSDSTTFDADRTVTRSGLPAINTGDSTVVGFLNNYFFPSTSPTSTLSVSGGNSLEFMEAGANLSVNLTWSATRPTACLAITSIVVNSVSQTLDDPFIEGHTQNGVLNSQVLVRNTNTTYSIVVSSTDKSSTTNSIVTWYWRRYWGAFVSGVPPTDPSFTISDANIIALTGAGVGTGNELSTTRVKTYNNIDGGGNYLVFAFPSAWGTPQFVINGLISTAFTHVRNDAFINAVGGTTTYQVWVSNTTQAASIAQFQIN